MMHTEIADYLKSLEELPDYHGIPITSVHTRDHFGSTPLHVAIIQNRADMVRELIAAGANMNALGERGETPLHTALGMDNFPIACLLLESGADFNIKDGAGHTAYELAEMEKVNSVLDMMRQRPQ